MLFQVNNGRFLLGSALCDAWIMADVLACTASILMMTGISVDRSVIIEPNKCGRSVMM